MVGGLFSGWLIREVRPGDVIDVQPPAGSFSPDLTAPAGTCSSRPGPGITPMLSIAASVLQAHPESTVTLIYGNRRSDSVMFADDVADLKDAYPARMRLVHVLSREPQEVELFSGRLDADRLRRLLPATLEVADVDHFWLCGPFGMVTDAIEVLTEFGVPAEQIHRELFYVGDEPAGGGPSRGCPDRSRLRGDRGAGRPQHHSRRPARHCRARRGAESAPRSAFRLQRRRLRHLPAMVTARRSADASQLRAGEGRGGRRLCADLPGAAGLRGVTVDFDS